MREGDEMPYYQGFEIFLINDNFTSIIVIITLLYCFKVRKTRIFSAFLRIFSAFLGKIILILSCLPPVGEGDETLYYQGFEIFRFYHFGWE